MSEPNEMACDEFTAVAAELALGVLTGRERAEALAHLERCDACRENVRQLTVTGEGLLGLLPASEPPPGFETRVMQRLGRPSRPRAGRTRRMMAVAAAVVAIAGGGLAGWGLHGAFSTPATSTPATSTPATSTAAGSALSSAALLTASRQQVGTIYLYNGSPEWFYMAVDLSGPSRTVICQLVSKDGYVTTVGSFRLVNGDGSWGSPSWAGHGPLAAARLVSPDGTVLATAALPPA